MMTSGLWMVGLFALASAVGCGAYLAARALERHTARLVEVLGLLACAALLSLCNSSRGFGMQLLGCAFLVLCGGGAWFHLATGGASRTFLSAFCCLSFSTVLSPLLRALALSLLPSHLFPFFDRPVVAAAGHNVPLGGLLAIEMSLAPSASACLLWLAGRFRPLPGSTA